MTNQDKIDLVTKLLQNGLDRISDDMDDMLFNPEARPIGRWEETHPSHTMVGVGEPGTMGWEGYACKKCWAREGTEEAHGECRHKV